MNKTQRAIKAAGGNKLVAEALGVSMVTICSWGRKDKFPADHVRKLSAMTDSLITPRQIRPDIFVEAE